MAIIKNLHCAIVVNGHELMEYPDTDHEDYLKSLTPAERTAHLSVVYIQVVEKQRFDIVFKALDDEENELGWDVNVLGLEIALGGGQPFRKRLSFRCLPTTRTISNFSGPRDGRDGSVWEKREFFFQALNTTDDEVGDGDMKPTLKGLGEIEVRVLRGSLGMWEKSAASRYAGPSGTRGETGPTTVSEKLVKGKDISHTVVYGEAQPMDRPNFESTRAFYMDGVHKPYAIFKFRYRTEQALKNLRLIPRSPSPSPRIDEIPKRYVRRELPPDSDTEMGPAEEGPAEEDEDVVITAVTTVPKSVKRQRELNLLASCSLARWEEPKFNESQSARRRRRRLNHIEYVDLEEDDFDLYGSAELPY